MTRKTFLLLLLPLILVGVGLVVLIIRNQPKTQLEGLSPILSITAFNQTQNNNATILPASANDLIVYSLTAENPNSQPIRGFVMEVNIASVSRLANLVDAQGANYNSADNLLIWAQQDIPADGSLTRKFTVKVKNTLPAGSGLVMDVKFNNDLKVAVARLSVAGAELTKLGGRSAASSRPYSAPVSGPSEWTPVLAGLLATTSVFVVRSRKSTKPV